MMHKLLGSKHFNPLNKQENHFSHKVTMPYTQG